nr:hypothetical protein [Tanacetum cinerariifolium]
GTGGSEGDQAKLPHDSPLSDGHTSNRAEAWLRSVSVLSKKKKLSKREFVSKQGRKNAKSRPTKDDSAKIDAELDEDMEYMDTEEAVYEGRQSIVDTARPDVSTARQELSTAGL